MKRKWILAAIVIASLAGTAMAADLPPFKWWRRAEVARHLGLTPDQQARLDQVFHDAADELIDRKGDVEKANLALRREIDQPVINRQNLQRLAARLSDARGKLFEREVLMLADMRSVLNDHQWSQLRAHLDRPQRDMERRPPPEKRQPGQPR
jgi:hypothetical protein